MPLTPLGHLPADLAQVQADPAFKRFNLFGLRFGPTRVRELRLRVSEDGLRLFGEVRLGKDTWVALPEATLDAMAERRFGLDTQRATIASLQSPLAARPEVPCASSGVCLQRSRAASDPTAGASGLQRRNATRRSRSEPTLPSASMPELQAPRVPPRSPELARAPSVRSMAAEVGVWEDETAARSSSSFLTALSHPSASSLLSSEGTSLSTPATSIPGSPVLAASELPFERAVSAYCDELAKPNTYGTDVELRAMAEFLQRPIAVLIAHRNVEGDPAGPFRYHTWELYAPTSPSPSITAQPIKLLLTGGGTGDGVDTNANHYVPLASAATLAPVAVEELSYGEAASGGWCLFDAVGKQVGLSKEDVRANTAAFLRHNADRLHALSYGDVGDSVADRMLERLHSAARLSMG